MIKLNTPLQTPTSTISAIEIREATDPSGGGVLYTDGGALKYRGSGGTVTTIANA